MESWKIYLIMQTVHLILSRIFFSQKFKLISNFSGLILNLTEQYFPPTAYSAIFQTVLFLSFFISTTQIKGLWMQGFLPYKWWTAVKTHPVHSKLSVLYFVFILLDPISLRSMDSFSENPIFIEISLKLSSHLSMVRIQWAVDLIMTMLSVFLVTMQVSLEK